MLKLALKLLCTMMPVAVALTACAGSAGGGQGELSAAGSAGAVAQSVAAGPSNLPVNEIKLPPGFKIEVYAANVPTARQMALSDYGTLFVGSKGGKVYAIPDADHDGRADRVITIASGLRFPNGVALKNGSLYVAEINRIQKFDDIEASLDNPPKPSLITSDLPNDEHHGWKYIRFGPDGKLYVPVGAPCNICEKPDPYAGILRFNADGSGKEVFARGIRNTVGFDWDPAFGDLWFTDNGRDWLGDDRPPDELNHAPRAGMHFGYPYCHGKSISDPDFGKGKDCSNYTPAAVELGPHVAALGMRFYSGASFPREYENDIFIAEHGSWNRSRPLGYRITRVHFVQGAEPSYSVFAEGWLRSGGPWGRPVDIVLTRDGSLLVSDDHAGAIYRISHSGKRQ